MTRDSQQSLEKSRSLMTKARFATAGLTLMTMVAAEKVMSSNYSQTTSKPEVDSFIPNLDNVIGFNPSAAWADVLACTNRILLKIHAPKEDPNRSVKGVILEMWNETTPNQRLRLVADSDQSYNDDKSKYQVNTSVVGGGEALLRGNPTDERPCDPAKLQCIDTPNGKKIKTTTLRGRQINPDGSPVSEVVGKVTADCPDEVCEWNGAWFDERITSQPEPVRPQADCPEGTTKIGDNPLMCQTERIVEVPVPVTEQPGQAPR